MAAPQLTGRSTNLLRRGSLYGAALAVQLAAATLAIPFITRRLEPSEYGKVALALVVMKVVAILAAMGLPAAITPEVFSGIGGLDRARTLVTATIFTAILIVALGLATSAWWAEGLGQTDVLAAARLAVVIAGLTAIQVAAQAVLQAQDRVGAFAAVTLVASVGGQALGAVLLLYSATSATSYLAGLAIASTLGAVLAIGLARLRMPRSALPVLRRAGAVALPTIPHSLSLYVLAAGDRVVIARLKGTAHTGRYDAAYAVGILCVLLLTAFNQAWAPHVFRSPDAHRWQFLASTEALLHRIAAPLASGASLAAPVLLTIVAPAGYDRDSLLAVAAILPAGVVPYVIYLASVHVLFQRGRTSALAWATPASTVGSLLLCVALVPPLGLGGAALATVIGFWLQAGTLRWASLRIERVRWHRRPAVIAAAATALAATVSVAAPTTGVWLMARLTAVALLGIRVLQVLKTQGASVRVEPVAHTGALEGGTAP